MVMGSDSSLLSCSSHDTQRTSAKIHPSFLKRVLAHLYETLNVG
jgi:hypothetical protein